MKKRKLNKKSIIIIGVLILILLIEIVNPIKLYNKHLLKELNYSDSSIETILKYNLKDEVLKLKENKTLNVIFSSKEYKNENFSIYKDINNSSLNNIVTLINSLISKGYDATEINYILRSGNEDDILAFLELDYQEDVSKYLKFDFSKLNKYQDYLNYQEETHYEEEKVVVDVNIGLNKEYYTNYNVVEEFSITMLVNKYNALSEDFVPQDLIKVDSNYAVDSKQLGNKEMVEAFIKMADDCNQEISSHIYIRSAYRDYQSQADTYDLYLDAYGKKYAENYVAHPGFSEHQTGLAVDIKAESSNTFAGTEESKWLLENAYKYGFILRYSEDDVDITGYKYESWHYRYVGLEIASYIHDNKMTYDEYYIRFLNK